MTRTRIALIAFAALATAGMGFLAGQAAAARHPNLDSARGALNNALGYLNRAPDIFGGHKGRAIELINAALAELRAAEAYR